MLVDPLALRHHVEGCPDLTVRVANAVGWLSENDRGSWRKHHRTIAMWRQMAAWSATMLRPAMMHRAYALAELRFTDRRRRDANNWSPTAKACIDGLVDAGVLPQDWSFHLIGPDMRIGPVTTQGRGAIYLHLWEIK